MFDRVSHARYVDVHGAATGAAAQFRPAQPILCTISVVPNKYRMSHLLSLHQEFSSLCFPPLYISIGKRKQNLLLNIIPLEIAVISL